MRPKDTIPINQYFGQPIGNGQDPDETWDRSADRTNDGGKLAGKGSQGGGSRPSRNPGKRGSATLGSSRPRGTQRIRG